MTDTRLLELLADGELHSGQDLADALGISRTAVWKQLKKLEQLGLEVAASRSAGYSIVGGIELLDQQVIEASLSPDAAGMLSDLSIHRELDSTNAELMRRLDQGAGSGQVCLAEQQTAGRGRRGRQWVSPFASNIYLSLSWEFAGGVRVMEGLSLAVGVAVARALEQCGVEGVSLKWPNDILLAGAKLGGILIEMAGDVAGTCQAVVGVGLNVRMPEAAAVDIDQQWTDLSSLGPQAPGRNQLLAAMLNELLPLLATFESEGFEPWRAAWSERDAYRNQPVVVQSGPQSIEGSAAGIDESGALLLETPDGLQVINGGEVSLRSA